MPETKLNMSNEVASFSPASLAAVLDQSVDCVKIIGLLGEVRYMNANGMCAMEIDDFSTVAGQQWADFWPEETQSVIRASYSEAELGKPVRFRAFCPTQKGTARWWDVTVSAVKNDLGEHAGYLAVSRDATENQTSRDALDIATSELRHRLKNTYTMIASLLMGFARGNPHHSEFAEQMTERLVGLSRAQVLFAETDTPCDLNDLVSALVEPFSNEHCGVEIERLPACTIDKGRADAIALVIGELTVNSSKHGAIKYGGSVKICGEADDRSLSIFWAEHSFAPVVEHVRDGGQGLALIGRIMRARSGTIDTAWRDDGLDVTLTFAL
ncbi:HWE histidine kinase domain-containing protein [Sphingobium limneticum]|nr:HWE histidine kinase domain-containing protein [Sphingobium limneticum]